MKMKTIHKHEVPVSGEAMQLDLAVGAKILKVEFLTSERSVFMWVEVPADLTSAKEKRLFKTFQSGDGIPEKYTYVGTTIDQYIPEAYHVYEAPVEDDASA